MYVEGRQNKEKEIAASRKRLGKHDSEAASDASVAPLLAATAAIVPGKKAKAKKAETVIVPSPSKSGPSAVGSSTSLSALCFRFVCLFCVPSSAA